MEDPLPNPLIIRKNRILAGTQARLTKAFHMTGYLSVVSREGAPAETDEAPAEGQGVIVDDTNRYNSTLTKRVFTLASSV